MILQRLHLQTGASIHYIEKEWPSPKLRARDISFKYAGFAKEITPKLFREPCILQN